MTYLQHPLSAAFPPLTEEEFQSLKDSIMVLGVQNPIAIYEGQVLDGWNRYCAAQELDLDCPTREIEGWMDPREFVLSQNKARRHLSAAQLIAIASKVYEWKGVGSNQHKDKPATSEPGSAAVSEPGSVATSEPGSIPLISSRNFAETLGVTQRSVEQFREVKRKAVPEIHVAVERGEIGLRKAVAIAQLPVDQQAAAVGKTLAEIKPTPKTAESSQTIPVSDASPQAKKKGKETTSSTPGESQALQDEIVNLRDALAAMKEENESLVQIVESGDQLAAALQEARKSRDLARGLQIRINSLMTELAEAKRDAIYWRRKAEKKQ